MHSVFEAINQRKIKLHSPWLLDALPALSGRDMTAAAIWPNAPGPQPKPISRDSSPQSPRNPR